MRKNRKSRGTGIWGEWLRLLYPGTIIEEGVRIFLPDFVKIKTGVYIGHNTVINGYYNKLLSIGEGSWIGPLCYIGGDVEIGEDVGIGPGVMILSSQHLQIPVDRPILFNDIRFDKVVIKNGADIGANTTILPGVTIGENSQIGAGSVVTRDIPDNVIAFGNPAVVKKFKTAYLEEK